jgi:uncharacterized protein YndB with AHSA1/START domain
MNEVIAEASNENIADKAIYRITINAPVERVWAELVKTDEMLPFFFGSVCRTENGLKVGEPMAMRSVGDRFTSVVGKVLEFDPPHRYAHTMVFTQHNDAPATVTYDLKPIDGGTEFTMTTTNVPKGTKTQKGMEQGSSLIINTLKAVVETGRPSVGVRMMLWMIKIMTPLSPAACKTENWPFGKIDKL